MMSRPYRVDHPIPMSPSLERYLTSPIALSVFEKTQHQIGKKKTRKEAQDKYKRQSEDYLTKWQARWEEAQDGEKRVQES